ncbi:two-component system response regulator containing LytTR DNA-binding domain [Christiangramia forsetii KT0803]|uniref:Two-component system response regulator containing LytTR DNA-binding domain n=3 Tax=Christiangramia forsetii TaxID=411153 RepID=A0LZM2_CHRFK|nr:DNA-binding response regulator [Christiangramia forsetii]CAL65817.1 two-component system response regulator containing LytTR DNA-binding domain [Christiangramia forsetii KT0803]
MYMNCVVVDDEELPGKILEQLIGQNPSLNLLKIFKDPIEALKYINSDEKDIDIIFLDILMPKFTGFDLIKAIKSPSHIILISSDKNYALKAFEFPKVTDYLLKPIQKERFLKAISKVIARSNNPGNIKEASTSIKEDELYINTDKRLIKINIPDINFIEAKGNFIYIKTLSDNYLVYSSLKKIESKLPSSSFLRVHRSYIINFRKIIDIQDNSILINNELIPVSRRYKPQLLDHLNLL